MTQVNAATLLLLALVILMGLTTRRDGWIVIAISLIAAVLMAGGRGGWGFLKWRGSVLLAFLTLESLGRVVPTVTYLISLWVGSNSPGQGAVDAGPTETPTSNESGTQAAEPAATPVQRPYSLVRDLAALPRILTSVWGGPARGHVESALALYDVRLPLLVPVLGLVCLAVLLFWALHRTSRPRVDKLALLMVGAALLVPPLMHRFLLNGATSIQPRYLIPAIVIFLGIMFVGAGTKELPKKATYISVSCFALANALSIAAVADRYLPLSGISQDWRPSDAWIGRLDMRFIVAVGVTAGVLAAMSIARLLVMDAYRTPTSGDLERVKPQTMTDDKT